MTSYHILDRHLTYWTYFWPKSTL